jgi:hypothetical protein
MGRAPKNIFKNYTDHIIIPETENYKKKGKNILIFLKMFQ